MVGRSGLLMDLFEFRAKYEMKDNNLHLKGKEVRNAL